MDDRFNTIAGWVLFAGIVALGSSIVASEAFMSERPEKMGYPIPGVSDAEEGGGEAEQPIEVFFAKADPARGAETFKKCASCHNADKGGANGLGPNLWGIVGEPVGKGHGFPFTPALANKGGNWDWHTLDAWLTSPKAFAPGTKMSFPGLSNPQDRANVIAYLNQQSDAPKPLPAAPAAPPATADGVAPKTGTMTEQQAGQNSKNVGGEGAPKVSGPASVATNKP